MALITECGDASPHGDGLPEGVDAALASGNGATILALAAALDAANNGSCTL